MQYWTKTKPDRPGYWWAKNKHNVFIVDITIIENVSYICYDDNEIEILENAYYNNFLWGSAPICEPVGVKI